jgi:hypothetical protein
MDEQPTCGQGLAKNAALPAKLSELTAAMGAVLDAHIPSLDLTDERSRKEQEVYQRLVGTFHQVAVRLEAIARQMDGSRDLPMGRHGEAAMASPSVLRSFERFVRSEQELLAILQGRLEEDQQMLGEMRAAGEAT